MNNNYTKEELFHCLDMKYSLHFSDGSVWKIVTFNGTDITIIEDLVSYHHKGTYNSDNAAIPQYDLYRNKRLTRLLL